MNLHEPIALLTILGVAYGGYACTVIGHEKVEGWPELTVHEHHVSHKEMRDRCNRYAHWSMSPEACAEWNFMDGRCDVWFSTDFPPSKEVIEHERLHCKGFDHVGQTTLRDSWNQYRHGR
jgi:hypothetical protein